VFDNSALGFVELEMKADGIVNFGTDLDNPNFAEVARAVGLHGVRIDHAEKLEDGLREAFAHDGPAVIDVSVLRHELAVPPKVSVAQAKGFTLWAGRSILSGAGDEVLEVAGTNLRQLKAEL
jgi:pyruvate dehydrogenase (quinone)